MHGTEKNHLRVLFDDSVALNEEVSEVGDQIGKMRVLILVRAGIF